MKNILLISALALSSISAFAVQYQAAAATLTGGAVLNGNYVQMNGGDMSWAVTVSTAGMYDIRVHYKQDYDATKKQNLNINGSNVSEIEFPRTSEWKDVIAVARLNQGNNTIAITNSWGWVDVEYIDVNLHENAPFNLSPNLVNANANAAAKKVFAFMQDNFQKKVISGVMTLNVQGVTALNSQEDVSHIRSKSGKTPVIVGFDFMHATGKEAEASGGSAWHKQYTEATVALSKELWNRGGIPVFCWHWRDPLKNDVGFYSSTGGGDKTTFDLTKACSSTSCTAWNFTSQEYIKMIEDIDVIAGYLKELQDAGVAVLWRPVHEASGGWFWWGAKGPVPLKLLYKLIYDRMTTHHGLNNLIWVWTSEGADYDWYAGEEYADIIGRDFYYNPQLTVNHASLIGEFEKLKNLFGTKKMIALSENGSVPYPENMIEDGASWSYFMPWYGDFVKQANSDAAWQKIMNDDYVITLEDMPGWGAYEPPSSGSTVSSSSSERSSSSNAVSSSSSERSSSSNAVSSSSSVRSSSSNAVSSSSSRIMISSSSTGVTPILNSQFSIKNSPLPIYYTLSGKPLGNAKPKESGVYIVKRGRLIEKIVVR